MSATSERLRLRETLYRIAADGVHRNALWMLGGQGSRLILQGAYFTLLARSLGTAGYGAFVSVIALAAIASPFATMGSGMILVQRVSRDPKSFSSEWGRALTLTIVTGLVLAIVTFAIGSLFLPATVSRWLLAAVLLADLIFVSVLTVCGQCYQAFGKMRRTAQLQVSWSALKLAAALALAARFASPVVWGELYLLATATAGIVATVLVFRELGMPRLRYSHLSDGLRDGGYFAIGDAARTVYDDMDKAMLSRLATLEATGLYGAAYRVIELSLTPVRALLAATFPGFFRSGVQGIRSSAKYGKPFIIASGLYGVVASVGLFVLAPAVPVLLGAEYREAATALRWLSVLPALKSVHYVLADTLTGAGLQAWRTSVQVFVAALNIAANLWLIPRYSWRGAAWASALSDGLMLVLLAALTMIAIRRHDRHATPPRTIDPPQIIDPPIA